MLPVSTIQAVGAGNWFSLGRKPARQNRDMKIIRNIAQGFAIGFQVFEKARLHCLATWPGKQMKAVSESNNSLDHISTELTLGVLGGVGGCGEVVVFLDHVFAFQHNVFGKKPAGGK